MRYFLQTYSIPTAIVVFGISLSLTIYLFGSGSSWWVYLPVLIVGASVGVAMLGVVDHELQNKTRTFVIDNNLDDASKELIKKYAKSVLNEDVL